MAVFFCYSDEMFMNSKPDLIEKALCLAAVLLLLMTLAAIYLL